ncbi:MAG TPA: hypothetical protein ENG32_00325 [bacterium]|nr:hypothetical protein [bacterium]
MQAAKEWLKQNKFLPRLSLKEQKEIVVGLLGDELVEFNDPRGRTKKGLRLYVVHQKEVKTILTTSYQLIQQLADIPEGSVIRIRKKFVNQKTVYEVELTKKPEEVVDQMLPYVEKLRQYKEGVGSEIEKTKEEVEKEIEQKALEESF